MAILKCKMCGGDIQATDNTYGTCGSCGTTSTLPKANDEKIVNLFNRANHFRRLNDFDKALTAYESILNEDNANAEAHWCAVLCRYGIQYVEDPRTHERVPTCRRAQFEPVLSDPDYLAALENAPDEYTKSMYEKEAAEISEIQKGILAISNKEEPYDVFICYKETTSGGSRTKDSVTAQEIYHHLTNDGYKVFFAKITLEDKLGQEYEPYIFSALNSAKVMLVIGTCKENFEAVWVKNEWSRFIAIMKKDRSRLLIPCYKDMDAYDIPDELSNLQSQDMSKVGFLQDILRGVKKVLDASKATSQSTAAAAAGGDAPGIESLMKRGNLFLEDSDWNNARKYFNNVLDIDPEYAPAYVGLLCSDLQVQREDELGKCQKPLAEDKDYKKAMRFADADLRARLEGYNKTIEERIAEEERREQERQRQEQERQRQEQERQQLRAQKHFQEQKQKQEQEQQQKYNELLERKNKASNEIDYQNCAKDFRSMGNYRDSEKLAEECEKQYFNFKKRRRKKELTAFIIFPIIFTTLGVVVGMVVGNIQVLAWIGLSVIIGAICHSIMRYNWSVGSLIFGSVIGSVIGLVVGLVGGGIGSAIYLDDSGYFASGAGFVGVLGCYIGISISLALKNRNRHIIGIKNDSTLLDNLADLFGF